MKKAIPIDRIYRTFSPHPVSGWVVAAACLLGGWAMLGGALGCASDDVGHTKTTTKRTIDSPTEKTTVTETREKDTRIVPR